MRPSPLRIHAALFAVALLFSANYVIAKLAMREFAPLSFAWVRIFGAALLLWVVAPRGERVTRADSWRIVLYSALGVVINATLFLVGLSYTTVQVAAVLITTIPVFALAAAIVLGAESASAKRIGGIALAAAGALLVVGGEGLTGTSESLLGTILLTANCLSYALYLVLSKPLMARVSPRFVVARMFAIGTVLLLPISALSLMREDWSAISPAAWLALAVTIIGPTVGAYLLNAWALQHADSSFVAIYTYVQPVLGTILGAAFLGEEIRGIVVLAAVLIFVGVWVAGRAQTGPVVE